MSHEPGKQGIADPEALDPSSMPIETAMQKELTQILQQLSAHQVGLKTQIERLFAEQANATANAKANDNDLTAHDRDPIINSLGEYAGAVAQLTDFGSHRAAEAAYLDSEERYRTLFENAGDGIFIMEGNRFIDCNARSLEMFGCSKREDFIGFPLYKFSPATQPNGRDSIEFSIEKISSALSGLPQFFEWLHTKLDGTPLPAEVTLNKVESGGMVLLQAIVRDITERRQTELALKDSVAFNHSLISSMNDGFAVLDAQGIHVGANPALCRMTGFSQEELIGAAPPFPYWPPDEHEIINAAFVETLNGNFRDFELNFQRKSGERFPVMISPSCVQNSNGEMVNFLATVKDITARKQAETTLAHTIDMLKRTGAIAKVGGWELDLNPQKLFWSLETCILFDVESLSAPTLEDAIAFYAPEGRAKITAAVQAAINHGTPYDLELKVVSARGRTRVSRLLSAARAEGRERARADLLGSLSGIPCDRKRSRRQIDRHLSRYRRAKTGRNEVSERTPV